MWPPWRVRARRHGRPSVFRVVSRFFCMVAVVSAGLVVSGAVDAGSAAAYPFADLELSGHGWGHGMGMGQWGAFGYSVQGSTYQEILTHYYGTLAAGGSTRLGVVSPTQDATKVRINMQEVDDEDTIVTSESDFTVDGIGFTGGQAAKMVPTSSSDASFNLWRGP